MGGRFPASLLLLLAGCVTTATEPPEPSRTFHTLNAGFLINAREGTVRYELILEPIVSPEAVLFLRVSYENPADPDHPYIERLPYRPADGFLFLVSPPLTELRADRHYRIAIAILDSEGATEPVDLHEIRVHSPIQTY